MFRKIGLLCAALAMFSIAGGHWAVLQGVAWMRMFVTYAQTSGSLAVAVDDTFDGQHPCALCQEIQAAKFQEHKERKGSGPAAPAAKEDAPLKALSSDPILRPAPRVPAGIVFPRAAAVFGESRTEAPPTPPPRQGAVAA